MRMACIHSLMTFMFVALLMNSGQLAYGNGCSYVQEACSVTRYPDICVHSLASFSSTAKRSPSKWARAGVSVTIGEVKDVAKNLKKLKKYRLMKGKNRIALSDCIECIQDALDELHKSLDVLRRLSKSTFNEQMSDLLTWISAALTDEDTCLDGFEDQKGKQVKLLQNQVLNATYITSNALALVNKLAATGLASITVP
ncbi:pectinesterase inhibitor 6-like [Quercus lobata]|uniref:Pectinesterase inhibitor domain-containing protein n=1 Tax=Quercus lobata TaxID=97700 RepID=A0A7N2N409_QUELO|nr:pectinesterase inhibitor 6-like [Quercus lobata]